MPLPEEDIRYRNSPYADEEDRNPRTVDKPRYRTTQYPGFTGGTTDKQGNLFFGQGTALKSYRADEEAEDRRAAADAAKQAILVEDARQSETPFGPADEEHRGIGGTQPNKWEQEDYLERIPSPYRVFKERGGEKSVFDPTAEGSTLLKPTPASVPELKREFEETKQSVGDVWEEMKRSPQDFIRDPGRDTTQILEGGMLGRVICTELMRQKLLSRKLWRDDIEYTKRMSDTTVRGYHFWAIPYVSLMRKSKLATRIIYYPALWRAEELSYQLGRRDKGNIKGKIFRKIIEPFSYIVGLFCKTQDYMVLYRRDVTCSE